MRGNILRDTNAGEGIVYVGGVQKTFTLERHWKSAQPPKVGGVVEVELAPDGEIVALKLIDETALAKEQAQKALSALGGLSKSGANQLLAKVNPVTLGAMALLAVAWLLLNAFSVTITRGVTESATFYEVLKLLNNKSELAGLWSAKQQGVGVYGLAMWAALALPLLPHFLKVRFSYLGYIAPLGYMAVVGMGMYSNIQTTVANAAVSAAEAARALRFLGVGNSVVPPEKLTSEMMSQTLAAISLGAGFYLSAAAALYLAFVGIKKLLAEQAMTQSQ